MKKTIFTIVLFLASIATKTMAQCDAPVNLASSYNNNVSTFTWDTVSGAVDYIFELRFQGGDWEYSTTANTNSYSFTGLFQSAPFEWRVTTNCGSGMSMPSSIQAYSTPCPMPSLLNVTNIAATTVTLNWTAAAGYNTTVSDFVLAYRIANTNNTWTSLGHTSATTNNVTGLLSSTTYEWRVSQSCMYSTSDPVIGQFTTAYIACNVPTNLIASNATSSSVSVSWSGVSGGSNYSVQYKPVSSSTWSSPVVINNTNTTLTGLNAATLYDCRVKANCSSATSTYVSTQFTTYSATCPAYGVNSSEFIDYFKLGSIERTSAKEIGGYINTGLNTSLIIGSNTNAGQFSAGFNPGIVFGENYAVFIDFNRNGSFADANERVVNPTAVNSGAATYNFNISIPNNVSSGTCKMRVVIRRSTSAIVPCATGFQGEVEDYTVTLVRHNQRLINPSNGQANETISEDPAVETATSVSESKVYPNPSTGEFTFEIQTTSGFKSYSVSSVYGQKVMEQIAGGSNTIKIEMGGFAPGIYILNVIDNDGKAYNHKLQKQ